MIKVLSTNITSPLGFTTRENYLSVKEGRSALAVHEDWRGVPPAFTASLFDDSQIEVLSVPGFTRYESVTIYSIREALSHTEIDVASQRTGLILSTTKANVEELAASEDADGIYFKPGKSAARIAAYLGFTTAPVVVCNACISGVTAQVLADRLINSGRYDNVVVCGADCQSPFVVAGFMSFKSLSPFECRPFDIERLGLNLGDASATIVFGKVSESSDDSSWKLVAGALNNDAYHVSAPSPSGDGTYSAASEVISTIDIDSLATVSVHGTATMFNDQMESKAIERAGLSDVRISALKGYYGHTLGAAGVLETIITMESIDDGVILPVRGYDEIGVSGKVNIGNDFLQTDKNTFLKLISGFGGCNGVVAFSRSNEFKPQQFEKKEIKTLSSVQITPTSLVIDGEPVTVNSSGKELLSEIYKTYIGDYPKYHKMDVFTKTAFLAAELAVRNESKDERDHQRAVVLFNGSSSIVADRKHIATYSKEGEFYPSPSVFLYTLPNIVTGEIAIRNGYKGETSLYILNEYDESAIDAVIESTFAQSSVRTMITGWVDCSSEDDFEANIKLVTI